MTEFEPPKGDVDARLEGPDGSSVPLGGRSNLATYAAADALAAAYAGDPSGMPCRIAFLYGSDEDAVLDGPSRGLRWSDVLDEYPDGGTPKGSVVTAFSYAPTLQATNDRYGMNKVVFHGRTQGLPDNCVLYRACLLGRGRDSEYNLLAIVDLASSGSYRRKPEGFELAVDWAVKFN